jgi:hypothetical protein
MLIITNSPVRTTDVETSHEAARLLARDKLAYQMLEFLVLNDRERGWTAYEISRVTHDLVGGLCPWHRLTDLRQTGLAEWLLNDDGTPVRRPGSTKRNQRATVVTPKGITTYRALTS